LRMCAVVGVMFLRTHFVRKSEASDMTTLLSTPPHFIVLTLSRLDRS
jgi:hypothetical protein